MEADDLVVTDRLFLRTEGYLRFGGNWLYIVFGRNVLEAADWVVMARLWWLSDDYLRFGGNRLNIIFRWIVLEASNLVVTDRLFLRTVGYLRFGGGWHHIIFERIVLDFFQTLRFFLALVLGTNWCTRICITCPIYAKSSNFYTKMNVSNLNVTNLYYF